MKGSSCAPDADWGSTATPFVAEVRALVWVGKSYLGPKGRASSSSGNLPRWPSEGHSARHRYAIRPARIPTENIKLQTLDCSCKDGSSPLAYDDFRLRGDFQENIDD